jgi:hypothetical protein
MLLRNISQIATGVPYSESPRTKIAICTFSYRNQMEFDLFPTCSKFWVGVHSSESLECSQNNSQLNNLPKFRNNPHPQVVRPDPIMSGVRQLLPITHLFQLRDSTNYQAFLLQVLSCIPVYFHVYAYVLLCLLLHSSSCNGHMDNIKFLWKHWISHRYVP